MERALEVILSKHLREDVEKCHVLDRKFPDVSCVDHSNDQSPNCGTLLCMEGNGGLVSKICCGNKFLIDGPGDSPLWANFKSQSGSTLMHTGMADSGIKSNYVQKSECARLENAKYLSDLIMLHLLAEESSLKAEIDFLSSGMEAESNELDEAVIQEGVEQLHIQCECLRRACLESIRELSCNDTLETSRLMVDYRMAHQTAQFDAQDRQLMAVKLNCSQLEIFRDIMALEDSALAEQAQCLDKIHTALQKYLDITDDIKVRFNLGNELEAKENVCTASSICSAIDSELRRVLSSLFGNFVGKLDGPDDELNASLLNYLDERTSALDSKSASSLFSLKEYTRVTHEVFDLLCKALHQLGCHGNNEKQSSKVAMQTSSSVYWNELSPFTGVYPQCLIDRLLQARKTLDATTAALQNLEISYELYSGSSPT
ncbi:unnamed protein product [Hydatigera taeniaeformis]|uniref:WPP domain-containing protein n=1 Tax=Hydatigena taeniaeformis TaxID=6205 RepID=A0A0R3X2Q9_HYDTA|nr:unnamed protein product [Hydatigera taeniaeformis]